MLLLKFFKFYSCHNFKGCSLCNFTRCKITKQLQPHKGVLQLMLTEEQLKMVGFVIIRPKSDRFGCHPTDYYYCPLNFFRHINKSLADNNHKKSKKRTLY